MTVVYFSKDGKSFMEEFKKRDTAVRWASKIEENGYRLECLLDY